MTDLSPAPWPWADAAGDAMTILLGGDVNLLRDSADEGKSALAALAPTLRAADLTFVNLEGMPCGSTALPYSEDIPHKKTWRHARPEMADVLARVGIGAVGLANNSAFPRVATVRAMERLGAAGVAYVGGGMNEAQAREPLVIDAGGTRVGFLHYTLVYWMYDQHATPELPGVAVVASDKLIAPHDRHADRPHRPVEAVTVLRPHSVDAMRADVRRLAERCDVAIASFHWSIDGTTAYPYQRELAGCAVEAGADVVVGHGPHRYQGVELIGGKPVMHSLANLAFDWPEMRKAPEGLLARLVLRGGRVEALSLVPVWRDEHNRPHLMDPREGKGADLFAHIRELSSAPMTLRGQEIAVDLSPA